MGRNWTIARDPTLNSVRGNLRLIQLVEQRVCLFCAGQADPLGEPVKDRRVQCNGRLAFCCRAPVMPSRWLTRPRSPCRRRRLIPRLGADRALLQAVPNFSTAAMPFAQSVTPLPNSRGLGRGDSEATPCRSAIAEEGCCRYQDHDDGAGAENPGTAALQF
jgi:hypothetical protein